MTQASGRPASWVFVLLGAFLAHGYVVTINAAASPFIAAEFGLDDAGMARAFGWMALGSFGAFMASRYVDRFGRRRLLLVFAVGQGLLALASFFAPTLLLYVAAQLLLGSFAGGLLAVTTVMTTEMFGIERRARAHSLGGIAARIGGGGALVLLSILEYGGWSWRWLWVLAATILLFIPVAWTLLPETPAFIEHAASRHRSMHQTPKLEPELRRNFTVLSIASFFWGMALSAAMTWIFYFPIQKLGLSAASVSALILVGGLVGLLGFPLGSAAANFFGRRPSLVVFGLCTLGGDLVFYLAPRDDSAASMAFLGIGFVLMSLCENAFIVAVRTWSTELFPTRLRGWVQGGLGLAGSAGAVTAKFALSVLVGVVGDLASTIALIVAMMLPTLLLFSMLPETLPRERRAPREHPG